jgi:phospholipase A-2-activating protein
MPGIGFVSCGNDGVVMLWSFSGELLQELHGHTAFVYSVTVLPDLKIVTCGEDRSIRIWENGDCIQTIVHPSTVWCVASLPNGDIVSGCSDGVARLWTRDASRTADDLTLAAYDKTLATTAVHKTTVGDLQLDKLPSADALATPGCKDGENLIVRVGNSAEVYTWSSGESKWTKIGEVVDSAPGGKKELYGKEFDYVFDVDLGDGGMKKIGYNRGDNPYEVAQEFLWREDLGQDYLDQVAKFIIQNVGDAPMIIGQGVVGATTGTRKDTTTSQAKKPGKYIPQRVFMLFESSNLAGLHQKIEEFAGVGEHTSLSGSDKRALTEILNMLRDTSKYHASKLGVEHYQLLIKLTSWPHQYLFPVLDLLRLLFLHPHAAEVLASPRHIPGRHINIPQFFISLLNAQPLNSTNVLLVLRCITNIFYAPHTRKLAEANWEPLIRSVGALEYDSKSALAASCVLLNYAVSTMSVKGGDIKTQSLLVLQNLLKFAIASNQSEILLRVLVSIGTFIWEDAEMMQFVDNIVLSEIPKGSNDVKDCLVELGVVLQKPSPFYFRRS